MKLSRFEFVEGIEEKKIPIIKLSRSRNGETGTATFLFIKPNFLENEENYSSQKLEKLTLLWNNDILISEKLSVIFHETRPFGIKVIFLLKKNKEWIFFFNFLRFYIRERGISL
jgi:photosystem II 13kDa protein